MKGDEKKEENVKEKGEKTKIKGTLLSYRGLYFGPKTIFIPPPQKKMIFSPPLATRRFLTPIVAFLS